MRIVLVSLLLLLPLAACGDSASENDAAKAAAVFYDISLSERTGGVPVGDFRARLRGSISPMLDSLIAQAGEAERRHAVRTGNSEPPYLQGDVFSSLFEGATAYEIGKCEADDATVTCDVLLVHDAPEQPVQWTDRVVLVAADGRWAVDDIVYGGDWDFAPKGTLQQLLRGVIALEE